MLGKEKCKALKEIRQKIAEQNDILFITSECTHKGECKGTCPKCESELRYLERELAVRQSVGKAVAVVGVSVGLCSTLTACHPIDAVMDLWEGHTNPDNNVDGGITEFEYDILGGNMVAPELAGDVEIAEPYESLPEDYEGGEVLNDSFCE